MRAGRQDGARRNARRLVRQLLTETLCLSVAGGALGFLFAFWTAGAVPALFMVEQAEQLDTSLDAGAMLLTIGVAALAGALFAVAPALQSTAAPPASVLRAEAGGISASRDRSQLRAWLVAGQVALSTALLLATGLAVSSLTSALNAGLGSTTRHVAFVSVELPGKFHDSVAGIAFRTELLRLLASTPGVDATGWASKLPVSRGGKQRFQLEGATTRGDRRDRA